MLLRIQYKGVSLPGSIDPDFFHIKKAAYRAGQK